MCWLSWTEDTARHILSSGSGHHSCSSLPGDTASELVRASHWATSGPSFLLILWQVQWAFVERMLGRSFPSQDIVCKVREAVFGGCEEWDRTPWIVMSFRVVFDSCACCGLVFAWDSISAFCSQFFYTEGQHIMSNMKLPLGSTVWWPVFDI